MEIDRKERWFMITTFIFILGAMAALIISVVGHHASLAETAGRIDPEDVKDTAPFDEPGLHPSTDPDHDYDWVIVAQAWQWTADGDDTPEEIDIPAGSTVRILASSVDVIHGLVLQESNANVMVVPGQISEVRDVHFDEPGVQWMFCHEYCGIGHHNMGAKVTVIDE